MRLSCRVSYAAGGGSWDEALFMEIEEARLSIHVAMQFLKHDWLLYMPNSRKYWSL